MELEVILPFRDKYNADKSYKKGDLLVTDDLDRVNDLVARKICVIHSLTPSEGAEGAGANDENIVEFQENKYDVEQMKEALKAIGVEVHHSCGVPGVSKKIAELTEEQMEQLSAKLSE